MHRIDAALVRSAALPFRLELPEPLADEIAGVWAEVEQLASLAAAYEHFTAGLCVIPHGWSKRHIALPEGTTLSPEQTRSLRWLVVDAVIDACELDSRANAMQQATGWVSACWTIESDAGLDLEPTLRRLWLLAEGVVAESSQYPIRLRFGS